MSGEAGDLKPLSRHLVSRARCQAPAEPASRSVSCNPRAVGAAAGRQGRRERTRQWRAASRRQVPTLRNASGGAAPSAGLLGAPAGKPGGGEGAGGGWVWRGLRSISGVLLGVASTRQPPTPACLISHQASAGPGRTPSPKPLWPLWPRGRAPPPLPPPHPLLGPPWPPALHSPQVGARAQRQPPPRPIRAESLPLSVCSAGGRGVSPGEGRGLALSAEDAGTPQPPECEAEGPPGRLDPPVPRPQPGLPSSSGMFFLLPLQGTAQGTETSTAKRTG